MSIGALELFFGSATQYYVTGRFAVLSGQSPVAGNLLHHAVEMYLKGGLSKTHPLPQVKRMAHDLPNIWAAFKAQFGSSTLDAFDDVIAALHQFEELRYPNAILAMGAVVRMGIERMTTVVPSIARTEPEYELFVADVDALVRAIFTIVSVSPAFFFDALPINAKEYLLEMNRQEWSG